MTYTFEGYDWSTFFTFAVMIWAALLIIGTAVGIALDDPTPAVCGALFALAATLFMWIGHENAEDQWIEEHHTSSLVQLGYSDVAQIEEGYNQWVASKDDKFVKLVVTTIEEDTYLVTEIQE